MVLYVIVFKTTDGWRAVNKEWCLSLIQGCFGDPQQWNNSVKLSLTMVIATGHKGCNLEIMYIQNLNRKKNGTI